MQKAFALSLPIWKPWGLPLELSLIGCGKGKYAQGPWNSHPGLWFSTTVDSVMKQQQKKAKKKKGPATSVIHVREETICEGKARIKRVKASQLDMFNKSPYRSKATDTSQDDLNSAKEHSGSFVSTPKISIDDNAGSDLNSLNSSQNSEQSLLVKSKPKKKNLKNKKLNESLLAKSLINTRYKLRNKLYNETLSVFISVCMYLGFDRQALHILNAHIYVQSEIAFRKVSIISYNEVLKKFSLQGNYNEMKGLLKSIRERSVQPNIDTFIYILSCIGRLQNNAYIVNEVKDVLKWMQEEKVSLDEVFSSGLFPGDSYQYCLNAVLKVVPDVKKMPALDLSIEFIKTKFRYRNSVVDSLNESLFTNKAPSPVKNILSQEEMASLAKEQIKTERRGFVEVPNVCRSHSSEKSDMESMLEKLESRWRASLRSHLTNLRPLLQDDFLRMENNPLNVFPFLALFDDDELVDLLMRNITSYLWGNEVYSRSLGRLAENLGHQCYHQFYCRYCESTSAVIDVYKNYCRWYVDRTDPGCSYVPRIQWEKLSQESIIEKNSSPRDHPPPWPRSVKRALGKCLLNAIISSITVGGEGKPSRMVFSKVMRPEKKCLREEIAVLPMFKTMFPRESVGIWKALTFPAALMPMVSPPTPRISVVVGGYILAQSDFVRLMFIGQQQMNTRLKESKKETLYPVFDSLDQMGTVPWKINGAILDIIKEAFLDKGWLKMDIPMNPVHLEPPEKSHPTASAQEKFVSKKKAAAYRKKRTELWGLWSHMSYKLSIANMYRDKVIWLPLNLDFRGRAYTIHPHLSHYSDDATRALLCFAQGKKLGPGGLTWLKLHSINLTGLKKRCSFQERIQYCEDVMDDILDSADNPLHGRMWWKQSDDPWQTLAACKELAAAVRSGDPENYESHLPIHQDGSCNGLQHYAALGRDKAGAMSVNLRPSSIPQDIYSDVVELVEETRKKDAEEGVEIAKRLEGLVQRKIIKQTVMTNVYGVTPYGAKLQIKKKLEDLGLEDFPMATASNYLVKHTFGSLGTLFSSAKAIQDWLINIAEGVSRNLSQKVEWVTPLGFPVIQHYSKRAGHRRSEKFDSDSVMVPDVMKQKNGFPPNYIHSLDSSHMMLTSIYSQHAGITFVSIHDCFWTHASTVPIMNKICREQFVSLHSLPILEDLAHTVRTTCGGHPDFQKKLYRLKGKKDYAEPSLDILLANVPKAGEFNLKEVIDSVYFFS